MTSVSNAKTRHNTYASSRVESGTRQNGCAHDEHPIERNLAHASELLET